MNDPYIPNTAVSSKYKSMTNDALKIFMRAYVSQGKSLRAAAKEIDRSPSTMRGWIKRIEESPTRTPVLKRRGRTAPGKVRENHLVFLNRVVEEHSEFTLLELTHALKEEFPEDFEVPVSITAMHKVLTDKLSFSLKKAEIYNSRRTHDDIITERFEYATTIINEGQIKYLENCVFVDETGFNLHLNRTQARSKIGRPARIVVTGARGRNVTIFGAISHRGLEMLAKHVSKSTSIY